MDWSVFVAMVVIRKDMKDVITSVYQHLPPPILPFANLQLTDATFLELLFLLLLLLVLLSIHCTKYALCR